MRRLQHHARIDRSHEPSVCRRATGGTFCGCADSSSAPSLTGAAVHERQCDWPRNRQPQTTKQPVACRGRFVKAGGLCDPAVGIMPRTQRVDMGSAILARFGCHATVLLCPRRWRSPILAHFVLSLLSPRHPHPPPPCPTPHHTTPSQPNPRTQRHAIPPRPAPPHTTPDAARPRGAAFCRRLVELARRCVRRRGLRLLRLSGFSALLA